MSITWSQKGEWKGSPKLTVKMTNTYLPLLEEIQREYGGSMYKGKKVKEHYLQVYTLSLTVEESKRFLKDVMPFLVIKKRQAELALLFSSTIYRRGRKPVTKEEEELRAWCMEEVRKEKFLTWDLQRSNLTLFCYDRGIGPGICVRGDVEWLSVKILNMAL